MCSSAKSCIQSAKQSTSDHYSRESPMVCRGLSVSRQRSTDDNHLRMVYSLTRFENKIIRVPWEDLKTCTYIMLTRWLKTQPNDMIFLRNQQQQDDWARAVLRAPNYISEVHSDSRLLPMHVWGCLFWRTFVCRNYNSQLQHHDCANW